MNPVTGSSINPISRSSVRPVTPVELATSAGANVANTKPINTALPRPVNASEFEEPALKLLRPSKTAEAIFAEQGVSPAKLAILSAKSVLVAKAISSSEGVMYTVDEGGRGSPTEVQSETAKQPGLPVLASDVSPNDQEGREEKAENSSDAVQRRQQEQEIQAEVRDLAARDREVRNHELAHSLAGGRYSGSPSYEFKRGPDGNNYAVNGEVSIDFGRAATPQATIDKMEVVRQAALAPAEPSSQDRKVAVEATRIAALARQELLAELGQITQKAQSGTNVGAGQQSLESESSSLRGGQQNDGQQRAGVDVLKAQRVSSLYSENSGISERDPASLVSSRA
jgi:hypothetical protein